MPTNRAPQSDETAATSTTQAGSQTLARGLRALEILAERERPLSINELAEGLEVHRSNAYRILRTLEEHRLVRRDHSGFIRLGHKLTVLARGVAPALHAAAMPVATDIAYRLGMTTFLTVLDAEEVVTLLTVEPTNVAASIARNPGVRHTVDRGAPGHALEASLSGAERSEMLGSPVFSPAARAAQRDGFAVSHNEVVQGVTGIAVPLRLAGEPPAALAVVHFQAPEPLGDVVAALQRGVQEVARAYR